MRFTTRPAILLFLFIGLIICPAEPASARTTTYTHFGADLPDGWDGEENTGFAGEKDNEYMLVFKIHDEEGENIRGVVSVFLLPPLSDSVENIAAKLAAMQNNSTKPQQEGRFWTFSGEPRTQFKASAITRVSATQGHILVIIVQDPGQLGGERLVDSLRGLTPEAREALGR